EEQAGVEDRRVDALRVAGAGPVVEGLDDADGGEEPVAGVAQGGEAPEGLATVPTAAVLPRDAGQRAAGLVVAGRVGTGAAIEASRVAIDEVGIDLAKRRLVAFEPPQCVSTH